MIREKIGWKPSWKITRYANEAAFLEGKPSDVIDAKGNLLPAVSEFEGNVLLNEGITALLNLLIGAAETAFNNANTYLGVGDSSTGESASQTGLQAAVNKTWKAMETSYPSIASQTVTFRAVFGTSDANYDWNEFTATTSSDDSGDNLNRKVSSQGTKASGQTWTLDLAITFS